MRLNTYQEILEYYLDESQNVCNIKKNPVVLKTDLFNEAHSKPKKYGIIGNLKNCSHIVGIEAQDHVTEMARSNLGNGDWTLMTGDIRDLPFKDNSFSVILDLSTLDHIRPSEVDHTLRGYQRILDDTGAFFLVTWIDGSGKSKEMDWNANNQYYFDEHELEETMKKYFSIVKKKQIETDIASGEKKLLSYLCTVWHGSTY